MRSSMTISVWYLKTKAEDRVARSSARSSTRINRASDLELPLFPIRAAAAVALAGIFSAAAVVASLATPVALARVFPAAGMLVGAVVVHVDDLLPGRHL